jgi:serine/threonine protein kinase
LVDLALEQKSSQRRAFLNKVCAGDDELRREVESLLASDERLGSFPAATPAQVAADLFRSDCQKSMEEGRPSASPPRALGRYEVSEEIGRGGMGVVYAAHDPELDRRVAIKLMRPETSESISASEGRARLMREAQAMARISHPNVIAVHDVGTLGEQVFIAMEYVEGHTLSQWLAERDRPWREIVSMFVQAGRGLAAAHAGGILHRDFKPENVLVGKEGRARVVDFGLARAAEPSNSDERSTADGEVAADTQTTTPPDVKTTVTETTTRLARLGITVTRRGKFGTPAYMAPEQLMGEPVDERTDQYSFCVALFQGLCGELPFSAENVGALLEKIKQRRVTDVPKLNSVPSWLRQVLLRGLSPAREDRYRSMDELLHQLTRRPTAVWRASVAALVLLAVLFMIGRFLWQKPNTPQFPSIAVLPLENLSHDPKQEYLADGLTDELITNLSKVGSVRVIARGSVLKYKSQPRSIPEIARDLKVDGVLEGTVLPSGDRVRIAAQFADARTGQNIWAESYEGGLGDVLALQARVARAILAGIRVKLTAQEDQRLALVQPIDSNAYLAYLRGIYYWEQGWGKSGKADINTAIAMFEQATALDPKFAPAHYRLAVAYSFTQAFFHAGPEIAEKALAAAQRSIALDPNLAEAYLARGLVGEIRDYPSRAFVQDYQRAVALSPNLPEAHWRLSTGYLGIGLLDEALAELNKVLALDPHNHRARYYVARVHLYQQKYDEAFLDYERSPDFPPNELWGKVLILFYRGEKTAAHKLISELRRELADNMDVASTYAILLAAEGRRDEAMEQIRRAIRAGEGDDHHFYHAMYNIASAHALMGDRREALQWLRRRAEQSPCYPLFERDPNLDNLRSDPEFQAWLGEMKALWERRRASVLSK